MTAPARPRAARASAAAHPAFSCPPARTPAPDDAAADHGTFVLVGGVPGAGKSTVLARLPEHADVRVLDPDRYRRWLRVTLPGVPYRFLRPVVHGTHAATVLARLLAGPASGRRVLLVHEPATRPRRRAFVAALARARGWRPVLVVLDVDRDDALAGQHRRGRVVRSRSFARHWERWSQQRDLFRAATPTDREAGRRERWDEVHVVDRRTAPAVLRAVLRGPTVPGARRRSSPAGRETLTC